MNASDGILGSEPELQSFVGALLDAGPPAHSIVWPADATVLSERADRWVVSLPRLGVVVKVYARRPGFAGFIERLWGGRAERAARRATIARVRGLPVPEVRLLERSETSSALALSLVPRASSLRDAYFSLPPGRARQELALRAAKLLATLHAARLYPSDFHEGNVLVEDGELRLIDPDGLRPVLWVSERRRVRNLERLLRDFVGAHRVPRTLRGRFLLAYASDSARARRLFEKVALRAAKKRRQYGFEDP